MHKAVIYYQLEESQDTTSAVSCINSLIEKTENEIVGVFVDSHNKNEELLNMTSRDLSVVSYLYINKLPDDDFNQQLLKELSRQEGFSIKYFHEL